MLEAKKQPLSHTNFKTVPHRLFPESHTGKQLAVVEPLGFLEEKTKTQGGGKNSSQR
jgi:hypothetical protein